MSKTNIKHILVEYNDFSFQDMAQLVVERPTLMNHILPEDGGSSSVAANLVLAAMVDLFYCYLIKAQQQGSKEYMWVSAKLDDLQLEMYHEISNMRCTQSQNSNDSRLVLQLSLPNPLKPGVKSRM